MPTKFIALLNTMILATLALSADAGAQTLKGSRASMQRQHYTAITYGYTFLRTPTAVKDFVAQGHLIRVQPTTDVLLHDVSYPYARPEVKTFIDRLSSQYRAACGEPMTVTSLTRPVNRQPSNASSESVHPTGMAVDLRIPRQNRCRSWLEKTLLSLEKTGVLDVTRERNPAHYHVAIFTKSYGDYVASLGNDVQPQIAVSGASPVDGASVLQASETTSTTDSSPTQPVATEVEYVVRKGDTLSVIADRFGVRVARLRSANGIRGNLIHAGQTLVIPATSNIQVAASESVTHKVRRGDTLWEIANRYGVTTNRLMRDNGLSDALLQPGQVLRIR
ncbi:MAG: DUF5715 family protein [Pseudohongiellaceae bacterium]|jgi:LysM repeat protein